MNKNEYYWITMHKSGEKNVEIQSESFGVVAEELKKLMDDGWSIEYGNLMNRRQDHEI